MAPAKQGPRRGFGTLLSGTLPLLAACSGGGAGAGAATEAASLPALRAEAAQLTDTLGRQVILRGFNQPALRSERDRPPYRVDGQVTPDAALFSLEDLDDETFDGIAASGLNTVRLRLAWEFAQPDPPPAEYNDAYFRLVDAAIEKARARGLYVVLDFDQFGWSRALAGNSGAPGWTTAEACASLPILPAGAPPQVSPAVLCQWTQFWSGTPVAGAGLATHYLALWQYMAQRFRGREGVALFDLLNEPMGGLLPPELFELSYLYPYYRKLAEAIRTADPDRLVGFQPQVYHSAGLPTPALQPIDIDNSLYMPHQYTLAYGPQRLDPTWLPAYGPITEAHVRASQRDAATLGTPQAWGEVGWSRTASADGVGGPVESTDRDAPVQFARVFTAAADAAQLGWMWANYASGNPTYGLNHGNVIDAPLMRELAQPFPRAIAGRVQEFSFDESGRIYRQRSTQRFAADSEIGLSLNWQYPDGICVYGDGRLLGGFDGQGRALSATQPGLDFDVRRQLLRLQVIPEQLQIEPGQARCPKSVVNP